MAEENNQFQTLIRKRGSFKSSLTHLKKFIDSIKNKDALTDVDILELQQKIPRFDSLLANFNEIQSQIELTADEVNLDEQYEEREKFVNDLDRYVAIARNLIKKDNESNESGDEANSLESGSVASSKKSRKSNISNRASIVGEFVENNAQVIEQNENIYNCNVDPQYNLNNIKLPTIELPKFDGKYEAWLEFRDTFESLIHENINITKIQKFHYLRASLQNEAAQVIRSIEFCSDNYENAYKALKDRYDNTRLLVHNHLQSIFSLNTINREFAQDIRHLNDAVFKHLRSLKQLGEDTEHWDTLIIFIVTSKLDKQTCREWEKFVAEIKQPSLTNLKAFLKNRADFLETMESKTHNRSSDKFSSNTKGNKSSRSLVSYQVKCMLCQKDHYLSNCSDFLKLPINERIEKVKKLRLCLNCLRSGHFNKYCRGNPCKKCRLKHHSLLHLEIQKREEELVDLRQSNEASGISVESQSYLASNKLPSTVLLSTAVVEVVDNKGKIHSVRVILDSGSQSSYITESLSKKLNLEKYEVDLSILGINNSHSKVRYCCNVEVRSMRNNFKKKLTVFILPEITGNLPSVNINKSEIKIPANLMLADPEFHKSGPVDMLIGCDLFYELLCVGQIKLGKDEPIMQKTMLGWILAGPVSSSVCSYFTRSFVTHVQSDNYSQSNVEFKIEKFWELEETSLRKPLSAEGAFCEDHFEKNVRRDVDGRFIVSIPFKDSTQKLGNSRTNAERRFLSIENKFAKDRELHKRYSDFMHEYEELGHMSKLDIVNDDIPHFYLPHHGVLKEQSLTTKLRVVFDASAPSDTGFSLNNLQAVGPTVQDDLLSIILRFRMHQIVVSADIEKMYRQILVEPEQRKFQRIVWRNNPCENLQVYQLNTVTYGTAAAAYLATRCVKQIAISCQSQMPKISEVIEHDFYVDDFLSGGNSVEEVKETCELVSKILREHGFILRKWNSNNKEVLESVSDNSEATNSPNIVIMSSDNENLKTLGICWCPETDNLKYNLTFGQVSRDIVTKRVILSRIAQIFDPLGLLSPCTIIAKGIIQELWQHKLSWDETIPVSIHHKWTRLKNQLHKLNDLIIPRKVICEDAIVVELHGFCDASELGYGGCIYIRSVNKQGKINVQLLTAKSKVAPLKIRTIPRLELCGALVLARLYETIASLYNIKIDRYVLWSDASIVLSWLKTPPNLLKTFVGNRVSEILELTEGCEWRHVPSTKNPADILSRGMFPSELSQCSLWWNGPEFLCKDECYWPHHDFSNTPILELRASAITTLTVSQPEKALEKGFPFHKFSSIYKLKKVIGFVMRFIKNCLKSKEERSLGPLSLEELNNSFKIVLRLAQIESFTSEYFALLNNHELSSKSNILSLTPFLDEQGLLRVGGRLRNSHFAYEKKYPILLSHKHYISRLIIEDEHIRMKHSGVQALLASTRENYWIISCRNLAKDVIRKCILCCRFKAKTANPIMGNIPASRFSTNFPFETTGVDYGGPFEIKASNLRNAKIVKCYLCLFVCFSTKAVHLEIVSSLSSDSFILTLRRFIARRGIPRKLYSDNGRNFLGAKSELNELGHFLTSHESELNEKFCRENVSWSFIPAYSPHFGGLWEAGIKSVKYHLKRTLGKAHLNFEQFYTLTTQIEAVLNSRPLCPISSDPNDYSVLTPAHFLVGRRLTDIPEPSLIHVPESKLSHHQRIQHIKQHFWQRWSKEYVSELQQRVKWRKTQSQLIPGTLVLIKEDGIPPMSWQLGRIVAVHPGTDRVARVATIRTSKGEIKRSFAKICPLPVEETSFSKVGGMLSTQEHAHDGSASKQIT